MATEFWQPWFAFFPVKNDLFLYLVIAWILALHLILKYSINFIITVSNDQMADAGWQW